MYPARWLVDDSPLSLLRRMGRLQDDMNRAFGEGFHGEGEHFPPLNLWVSDDEAIAELEVPGVALKDMEVSVVGDTLQISGRRDRAGDVKEDEVYHRRERFSGVFCRAVSLPFRADPGLVSASCRKGILRIVVPRSEQDKPKKIEVVSE